MSSTANPTRTRFQVSVPSSDSERRNPDIPGGKLCLNFSAFSESSRDKVYKYLEHRILNLVTVLVGPMAAIFLAERPVVELGLIRTVVFFTRAAEGIWVSFVLKLGCFVPAPAPLPFLASLLSFHRLSFHLPRSCFSNSTSVDTHTAHPFSWQSRGTA